MQGARRDAVRALLAVGNAAARRLWQLEIIIILWRLLRVDRDERARIRAGVGRYGSPSTVWLVHGILQRAAAF